MQEVVKQLAHARNKVAILKEQIDEAEKAAIAAIPGYMDMLEQYGVAVAHEKEIDTRLRKIAEDLYQQNQNKKPHDAVTVKIFREIDVPDEQAARDWSLKNFTPALKLDHKVLEKAAKDGTIPQNLLTVRDVAKAQIATDLTKYL